MFYWRSIHPSGVFRVESSFHDLSYQVACAEAIKRADAGYTQVEVCEIRDCALYVVANIIGNRVTQTGY
jgi:hypothetical protein